MNIKGDGGEDLEEQDVERKKENKNEDEYEESME